MRSVFAAALVVGCVGAPTPAISQSRLPPIQQLLIVGARTIQQATTTAPITLTLTSGTRVTVATEDVHEYATGIMRTALMTQASPPIEPSLLVVLYIRSRTPADRAQEDVTLFSGAIIRVRSTDISDGRLTFLRTELSQAVSAQDAATAAPSASSIPRNAADPPVDSEAVAVIRSMCAKEWPDDFRMRAYCQTQQDEGLAALRQRPMTASSAHITIRTKCATEWPTDYRMRNYCEEQQLKALAIIR